LIKSYQLQNQRNHSNCEKGGSQDYLTFKGYIILGADLLGFHLIEVKKEFRASVDVREHSGPPKAKQLGQTQHISRIRPLGFENCKGRDYVNSELEPESLLEVRSQML
jgi:hypothetical protein